MKTDTENENNMKALFIIVNAGFADDVVELARETGVVGATIINARGAGAPRSIMGITVDTEKEMIFSIVSENVAGAVMAAVKERAGIKTPAHAVCFAMPVDRTAGIGLAAPQTQP